MRVGLLSCPSLPFIEVFGIDAEKEVADKLYVLDSLEGNDALFEDMRSPLENALLLFHYNQKMLQSEQTITPAQAVLGVINGMVGSLVLLLPVLALQAGYITSLIGIIITGASCAFSSWIYFQHLGDEPDIGHALRQHFNYDPKAKVFYDSCAWLFIVLACLEYFQLIAAQWTVILPATSSGVLGMASVMANGLLLLGLVLVLKYWQYGATTMAYGIASIAIYLIYLLSVLISNPASETSTPLTPFTGRVFPLIAAMSQGFMIQVFLIPFLQNIKDHKEQQTNFSKYTFISYIIGCFVYLFVAEVGAFGIAQRTADWSPLQFGILAYLPGSWQLRFICVVYTLHLYSVFPEFLLISKRIFFENLEFCGLRETSRRDINRQEIVYISSFVVLSMLIAFLRVPVEYLMMINGGILGSMVIYIIPSMLHIRCMYFLPAQSRQPFSHNEIQQRHRNSQIEIQSFSRRSSIGAPVSQVLHSNSNQTSLLSSSVSRIEHNYVQCECPHYLLSSAKKGMMGVLLVLMILLGLSVMVFSIMQTFEVRQ